MDFLMILLLSCMACSVYSKNMLVVTEYGAVGDQKTNDLQAFLKMWAAACASTSTAVQMLVPPGKTFLIETAKFVGPCKPGQLHFKVDGNITAPSSLWGDGKDAWIEFNNVNGLVVEGNGQFNGEGSIWWKHCPTMGSCYRPTQLLFYGCTNLQVNGITSIDSPRNHFGFKDCHNCNVSNVHIIAPGTSPNTDGIDISTSVGMYIIDTYIATGDDCIAFESGSAHIYVLRVTCGPGHGISIGSLGLQGDQNATAEEIHVQDSIIKSATNGLRIKTWQGAGGYAKMISFSNITIEATRNPIIIDQYYCPHSKCKYKTNAVKISNVTYNGVQGTAVGEIGINLSCSKTSGCTGIVLNGINITSADSYTQNLKSTCINAHGTASASSQPPIDCLLP